MVRRHDKTAYHYDPQEAQAAAIGSALPRILALSFHRSADIVAGALEPCLNFLQRFGRPWNGIIRE